MGVSPIRHVAFWHITSFLAHPLYRNVPFANMRRVQQSIALGNYCCLGDGKAMQAVATWQGINVAALLRTYPRYAADASATMDGVFMTSLTRVDRATENHHRAPQKGARRQGGLGPP